MNIIIVAGGLGTRFQDLSVFPKILLPTKAYNSLLEQNYEIFVNGWDHKLFLIINEKYYDMTVNYCHVNNIDVKIIKSTNTNGSYNTILSVYDQIPHENVLFIWSDLELSSIDDSFNLIDDDTIFTYNGEYRYGIDDGKITYHDFYDGNIPGIYYLTNLNRYFSDYRLDENDNYDLIEAIKEFNYDINACEYQGKLEEYRDKQTYINHIKETNSNVELSFKTRFFNMIEPDYSIPGEYKIKKWAVNSDYYHLIRKEYDWYNKLKQQDLGNYTYDMIVPKVYDGMIKNNTGFVMALLDNYMPLHEFIKTRPVEDVQRVYKTIHLHLDALSRCKKEVDDLDFYQDLKKEIITKVIDRCEKIKYMLIKYEPEQLQVLLEETYNYLCDNTEIINHKTLYCVCHGDLNGSNVLVHKITNDVKFIDPRGYFGYTTFYGWQDYEYAKLLYCLDGYDDFNNLPQVYGLDIPQRLKWFGKINYLNKKKYKVLVGVIWIALAGYISQDIMKANIAYEYGIQMLQESLKENE